MGNDKDIIRGDNANTTGVAFDESSKANNHGGTSLSSDSLFKIAAERRLQMTQEDSLIVPEEVGGEKEKLTEEPKPWKQTKKPQTKGSVDEIEIFESKSVVRGPSFLEITSPENGYLKIICKEDCEYLVPCKVVESFQCVDVILHGDAVFKENLENIIRFPDIQAEIMEYVLRFVFIEHLNKLKAAQYWGANSPRLVFQFEVDPRQVMDLIYVAHYLGIEDLLNVTATMVARHLQDVPDVSSMPVDLAWCVAEQFTAQELFDAEEREDFLSLHLGTDVLWEKHCKKFLREDIIRPITPSEIPPSYSTWGPFEGPPPTSWKSLFMALDLQQLADRQDGSANELFFGEVAYKGKCAHSHTIRPMFYEWVLKSPGSLPFGSYIAQFPNLLSLHLVNLPLGNFSPDGASPCLVIGDVLQSHPLLQILDVSETGFTAEAAILLSQAIHSHPRLQVLRLAYNKIGKRGFIAIAQALPFVRTLKLLDVRENGITTAMSEDAVAAIHASALEELYLDGNLKNWSAWRRVNGKSDGSMMIQRRSLEETHAPPDQQILSFRFPQKGKNWSADADKIQTGSLDEPDVSPVESPSFSLVVSILSAVPPSLRTLQLTQCELVDTDMVILVEALNQQNTIQILDLGDNAITAIGAIAIFTWLQGNESLLELSLHSNRITDSCSEVLEVTLRSGTKLKKLSMKSNHSYGEEGLLEIISAGTERGHTILKNGGHRFFLDLRSTDISFSTRGRIQRRTAEWSGQLHLLI